MKSPLYVSRNLKSAGNMVSLNDLDDWMDAQIEAKNSGSGGLVDAWRRVPWLFRGVALIAQGVASLPFVIENEAGEEVDSSEAYENKLEFLPRLPHILSLLASCLVLMGRAYMFKEANRFTVTAVRWWSPFTVEPILDKVRGLIGFIRRINGEEKKFDIEQVLYFWQQDPFVEVGPPTTSAGQAALDAAGVLLNVDKFAAYFFERGAVKATILTIEGTPGEGERARIKDWWARFVTGIKNAWGSAVFNAMVKPVVVGEGISELQNVELTTAKREDIATALGVPQTKLFSNAANYATAQQDELSFLVDTIIPLAQFIADTLNDQLLKPLGFTLRFLPDTLDAMQADEKERAQALASLTGAGVPLGVAMEMLGFELPDGMEYDDFNPGGKFEKKEPAPIIAQGTSPLNSPGDVQPNSLPADASTDSAQKAAERLQYKAFIKRNPKRAFRFETLDAAEQAELVAEVHQENEMRARLERFDKALNQFDEAME